MNYNLSQQTEKTARVRSLFVAALVLACAFGTVTNAAAQRDAESCAATHSGCHYAAGGKLCIFGRPCLGYVKAMFACPTARVALPGPINAARPEATLFADCFRAARPDHHPLPQHQCKPQPERYPPGTPEWQRDVAEFLRYQQGVGKSGGIDRRRVRRASCPNAGAIPCLLLQSIGNQQGPTGGSLLANTTFVQRLNTKGGSAPTTRLLGRSDSARAVHCRLLLLPRGQISTSLHVRRRVGLCTRRAPGLVLFACAPPGGEELPDLEQAVAETLDELEANITRLTRQGSV